MEPILYHPSGYEDWHVAFDAPVATSDNPDTDINPPDPPVEGGDTD